MALRSLNLITPKAIVAFFLTWFVTVSAFSQKVTVLFVGNSLTYSNNLPELVKQIAKCDRVELTYRTLAFPNYALEDHLNGGQVTSEIKSRVYDFVIVQQGPSSQEEGRSMLLRDGLKFHKLCAENKTKLAFFTVWPAKERFGDFQRVIETYKLAADSTRGIFCPAGNAWLNAWEINSDLPLYSLDNFHPSYQGSLLAALVIYGSIKKRANLNFANYNVLSNNTPRADFKTLIQAAQQALSENRRQNREKRK